jgi:hypothetical protein
MINRIFRMLRGALAIALRGALAIAAFGGVLVGLSDPATARVWVGFGFPLYVAPPTYYPPPAYYPPPVYYSPPAYYPPPAPAYYPPPAYAYAPPPQYSPPGQSCVVAGTVCAMEHPVAPGSSCYCTTAQGRAWGRAT